MDSFFLTYRMMLCEHEHEHKNEHENDFKTIGNKKRNLNVN